MDKAARQRMIESYGNAYQTLIAAIREFPKEMWQYRPAPDSWTIHETIVHIADSEANSFVRARKAIAEPGSAVIGYDEPRGAKGLDCHPQSTAAGLRMFKGCR